MAGRAEREEIEQEREEQERLRQEWGRIQWERNLVLENGGSDGEGEDPDSDEVPEYLIRYLSRLETRRTRILRSMVDLQQNRRSAAHVAMDVYRNLQGIIQLLEHVYDLIYW